jgi:uncharacterized protein (TIGR00159 family)
MSIFLQTIAVQTLFNIGFLPVSIWDVLDVLIVGILIYQVYKLLRGSIAFNIFIGVVTLYVFWMVVDALGMDMLKTILGQFVSVGVLILIIIFQPEVRRFLLFLGNTTLRQRFHFLERLFPRNLRPLSAEKSEAFTALLTSIQRMSRQRTGALIVIADGANLDEIVRGGVVLEALVSQPLLESIFVKEGPLHDGAVIITGGKIHAASCVLPLTDRTHFPTWAGLRHRAAVGITERAKVGAIVVSEENGKISTASEGQLHAHISTEQLQQFLARWMS